MSSVPTGFNRRMQFSKDLLQKQDAIPMLYSYASLYCITLFFLTISIAVYCHMFVLPLE